jgi:hypothetical protein
MRKNRRIVFIQRVTASHQAGIALSYAIHNAMRDKAVVTREKNDVTGSQFVQFLTPNCQDIPRQNTWEHATTRDPNVHTAEGSEYIGN